MHSALKLALLLSAAAFCWNHAAYAQGAPGWAGASTAPTRFETVPPNEGEQIAEIVQLTQKLLQQRYPEGMARRAVHPKDHGCVQASFTINPDIPENYRVGLFATPGQTTKRGSDSPTPRRCLLRISDRKAQIAAAWRSK